MSEKHESRTPEEKRAFAKHYLALFAMEQRAFETHHRDLAAKYAAFAAYVEHRAVTVDSISEEELELMIADWLAGVAAKTSRTTLDNAQRSRDVTIAAYRRGVPSPTWKAMVTLAVIDAEKKDSP